MTSQQTEDEVTAELNRAIENAWLRWCILVVKCNLGEIFDQNPPFFSALGIRTAGSDDTIMQIKRLAFAADPYVSQPVDDRRIVTIIKDQPLSHHVCLLKLVEPHPGQPMPLGPYHIDLTVGIGFDLEAACNQLRERGLTAEVERNNAHEWLSIIDPDDPEGPFEFKILVGHMLLHVQIDELKHRIPAILDTTDSD